MFQRGFCHRVWGTEVPQWVQRRSPGGGLETKSPQILKQNVKSANNCKRFCRTFRIQWVGAVFLFKHTILYKNSESSMGGGLELNQPNPLFLSAYVSVHSVKRLNHRSRRIRLYVSFSYLKNENLHFIEMTLTSPTATRVMTFAVCRYQAGRGMGTTTLPCGQSRNAHWTFFSDATHLHYFLPQLYLRGVARTP